MPTGNMVRRQASNGFRIETRKHAMASIWMDYLCSQDPALHIQHKGNMGEKRIGRW
jgi:hypothetical protein